MLDFFDALETRSASSREAAQFAALAGKVNNAPALQQLPILRKHELLEAQKTERAKGGGPFGGFATSGWGVKVPRVFASPGPIYEPEGASKDYWRLGRAVFAAGFRAGDLIHNAFSYHMTPGGLMLESGAHAVGCSVFPAGVGQTEQQLAAIVDLKPNGYMGTPSFLKILIEKAVESNTSIGSLKKALLGGEAFPPSLRDWLQERGITGYQCLATADLGLIAYETPSREGMVVDEGVIVEVVRPGTNEVVPDGEVGELVVTTLNPLYPLIRFGTGDMTAILAGTCPTGRTNKRIKGWMGRADQTTKMRGMFVHPGQVNDIIKRFPEALRARLVVSGEMAQDQITLKVEASNTLEGLSDRIAQVARDITKLRMDVLLVASGSLPNDGKVIEDTRSYQ